MVQGFEQAQREYEHKMNDPFTYFYHDEEDEDEEGWGEPDYYKEWLENDR